MELPFELDPDVVALSLLLESRERNQPTCAASYRHRESDEAPPDISATLEGPGWTAEFAATDPTGECGCRLRYGSQHLPEGAASGSSSRREGTAIRGTTPLGSFSGEATVPATPRIENSPGDTLRIRLPADTLRGLCPFPSSTRSTRRPLHSSWRRHDLEQYGRLTTRSGGGTSGETARPEACDCGYTLSARATTDGSGTLASTWIVHGRASASRAKEHTVSLAAYRHPRGGCTSCSKSKDDPMDSTCGLRHV